MIKNKSALMIFILGTFFAWFLHAHLMAFFSLITNWPIKTGLTPLHFITVVGYLVWLSWLFLAFSKKATLVNLTLWGLTLTYTGLFMIFYAIGFVYGGFAAGLFYFPFLIWHATTLVIAYHSFKNELNIYQTKPALNKSEA